jgi:hypothetical protein
MKTRKVFFTTMVIAASLIIFGCLGTTEVQEEAAQPTNTPVPGWTKFEGEGIELWLPDSYVGGDISENLDSIVALLRDQGPDFEQIAQMIEQNPDIYALWATDSEVGSSGFLTNVNIIPEQVISTMSIDTYLDAAEQQFPPQFQVVERDNVSVGKYDAGRLVVEFNLTGVVGKELLYAIKDGNTMWIITFATGLEEFDDRLPEFEQSVSSFQTK